MGPSNIIANVKAEHSMCCYRLDVLPQTKYEPRWCKESLFDKAQWTANSDLRVSSLMNRYSTQHQDPREEGAVLGLQAVDCLAATCRESPVGVVSSSSSSRFRFALAESRFIRLSDSNGRERVGLMGGIDLLLVEVAETDNSLLGESPLRSCSTARNGKWPNVDVA